MANKRVKGTAPDGSEIEYLEYCAPEVEKLLKLRAQVQEMRARGGSGFADVFQVMRQLAEASAKLGGYYLAPPEELLNAAQQYFAQHVEAIRETLRLGGADASTIAAAVGDYGLALCGLYGYNATPQQMENTLRACKPLTGFVVDKYGWFLGLLLCYQRNILKYADYVKNVKNEPDPIRRDLYLMGEVSAGEFTDLNAAALLWLQDTGVMTAADFAGVEQDTISKFLNYVQYYGQSGQFVQYIFIARHALNATPEQVRAVNLPPLYSRFLNSAGELPTPEEKQRAALDYLDFFDRHLTEYLEKIAGEVEAVLEAPTPEETEQAKKQARETAKRGVVTIPENYALIMSRGLWAAQGATKDGQPANRLLPISAVIDDYLRRNPAALKTTPLIIQKAIEGVNLLQQLKRVRPANGIYTFDTNLTEFSELCGFADANAEEKQRLLTALLIIDGVFVVVWRPNGPIAQRILTVEQYSLAAGGAGRLRFHVYASGLKGRPNLISRAEMAEMRAREKGAAKMHFRGQIIAKGHAVENDLIEQVFEYREKLGDLEQRGDMEQYENAKISIRKHKARDRKLLRSWFEDWAKRGIISYTLGPNKSGVNMYNWRRLIPPTPEELDELRPTLKQIEEQENQQNA